MKSRFSRESIRMFRGCAIVLAAVVSIATADAQTIETDHSRDALDPSGPHPPPPDDPGERDLAKRPRFMWRLQSSREAGCFPAPELFKPGDDDVPAQEKFELLRLVEEITPRLTPRIRSDVEWYVHWGTYASLRETEGLERRLEATVAEWDVGPLRVRVSRARAPLPTQYVGFRIRMPRSPSLELHDRPVGTERDRPDVGARWEYVPKAELHEAMRSIFGIGDELLVEFTGEGELMNIEGVDVLVGKHRRPRGNGEIDEVNRPVARLVSHSLLITDSDPQYICMSFDVGSQEPPESNPE